MLMNRFSKLLKLTALSAAFILAVSGSALKARAEVSVSLFPNVTQEMTNPAYWGAIQEMREPGSAVKVLASSYAIDALNRRFIETPDCSMTDLAAVDLRYDGDRLKTGIASGWESDRSYFKSSGAIYDMYGNVAGEDFYNTILSNMLSPSLTGEMYIRYGICTQRTDIRACPTMQILTDAPGDNDFDYFQLAALRVNEPVVIKAVSTDGLWYYIAGSSCGGWVRAADIAVCRSREEWLDAWQIPNDLLLVVTQGKIYLERSNNNSESSGKMLTMGTTLRIARDWEYSEKVTNRSAIQNYAVWLPLRDENGYYTKKVALISQHNSVSIGYLPLTQQNILNVAFSMLGDAYGWGSMLDSADCSAYTRDIYKCFGLDLPRNTTWQKAMPVVKCAMGELPQNEAGDVFKKALLDTLPAGTLLYFPGHTMMYLGTVGGQYYVVSSVSSMANPETGKYLRVRSVTLNTLEIRRMSGKTWMNCLDMALIPYEAAQ